LSTLVDAFVSSTTPIALDPGATSGRARRLSVRRTAHGECATRDAAALTRAEFSPSDRDDR
jgi:hypothetical protein